MLCVSELQPTKGENWIKFYINKFLSPLEIFPKKSDIMRLLHTMLRVRDLKRSIKFYTETLGMSLIRSKDYPSGRFTLAFLGYGCESENSVLELTHNWDKKNYDHGDGYGHIAVGVEDVYEACEKIRLAGGIIDREPGPMKFGDTILAFVKDPDGYKIELLSEN